VLSGHERGQYDLVGDVGKTAIDERDQYSVTGRGDLDDFIRRVLFKSIPVEVVYRVEMFPIV
jgi:hypothetical protein